MKEQEFVTVVPIFGVVSHIYEGVASASIYRGNEPVEHGFAWNEQSV
jgi:hypothetical protein